jgi:hypothetical protein
VSNQQLWGLPPEYFLGGEDVADNTALTLRPGQHLQADILLTHEAFYSVTVSVANVSRRGGVNLQIYDPAGHLLPYPSRYDQREQAVHLNLPKGRYVIEGQSLGAAPMFGSTEVTVQNTPVGIALPMLPLNPISVTIRREFTAQNQPQTSIVSSSGQSDWASAGVNLTLRPVAGNSRNFGGGNLRRAPNDSDNTSYLLENVRPGSYWVQGFAFQGYIASISSGGVDLAKTPLVIGAGGTSPAIEIVLRNDGASLSVSLNQPASTTGNQAAVAYVSLVPQSGRAGQLPDHIQISQNVAQISNLPPGSYRVLAFDEPQQLEYMNPQAMSAFAGKGQTVTLEAGGSAQVSLDVIPTDVPSQ